MTFVDAQPVIISHESARLDYDIITRLVPQGARVLDLGCGSGELMQRLVKEREAIVRGVDLHQPSVSDCISKGLSVFHGDIQEGLADLRDDSLDYIILSRTLQQVSHPETTIREMLRVAPHAIVSFPNFAYWRIRLHLVFKGTLPVSPALPYEWFNTPNIRLITLADFTDFCHKEGFKILDTIALDTNDGRHSRQVRRFINWRAEYGIFLLGRG